MSKLSAIARNAPKIFYALGLFWVGQAILVPFIELNMVGYSALIPETEGMMKFAMYRVVERALYDGLFLFGIGLNAEILLAIYHKGGTADA